MQPPGMLSAQEAAPGMELPEAHVKQVLAAVAPVAALYFPAGQGVQGAVPVATAYVPAGHKAHALPGALVRPAGQAVQPATAVAPAAPAPKPAGQGQQAAGGMEYVAAGQEVAVKAHEPEAAGLYADAAQAAQCARR